MASMSTTAAQIHFFGRVSSSGSMKTSFHNFSWHMLRFNSHGYRFPQSLKSKRRRRCSSGLVRVSSEKAVGINLNTTNSAVAAIEEGDACTKNGDRFGQNSKSEEEQYEGEEDAVHPFPKQNQKWKSVDKQKVDRLVQIVRKGKVKSERIAIMASQWWRALRKMQGKLKGTEFDPLNGDQIPFSEFMRLLNSNMVQFIEYADYGQKVSVILPHVKEAKGEKDTKITHENLLYRRHAVEKMPVDCWNAVWKKLHHQIINVDVINVNPASKEVYSTMSVAVLWSMRIILSLALFLVVDRKLRPIYTKVFPRRVRKEPVKNSLERPVLTDDSLGSLGKSRAKFISVEDKTGITFDDFAGQEYIKRELQEVVRILKNGDEFENKGIYCPKGVLLHGPPGTGKTLLAKAIAGEAGLPFFATNGTDFVEMFVGVAAARVKHLFSSARKHAPSIIFIDEIDAIGSKRGGPDLGGGGAEREQGLLQILNEMDGFRVSSSSQVLVIGATNRQDILDPALLRKGRFDKIIRVGLPSLDGRLAILKVHAKNKFFRSEEEKDVLLQEIAELSDEFSGAELQNILNEAGILTARNDRDYIERDVIMESLKRQRGTYETGQEDNKEMPEEIKLRLAHREAAVAVLECRFPDSFRVFTETNIYSTGQKPNMKYLDTGSRVFSTKSDHVNSIIRACAPRVIEEEVFGPSNLSWVSASAIFDASEKARTLVLRTGMTAFGNAYYRYESDLVPSLGPKLDALLCEYIRFASDKCLSVLREHRSAVESISGILLEKGEMKAEEIWRVYGEAQRTPQPNVEPVDEYGAMIHAGRWGNFGISLPGRVTFAPGNMGYSTFGATRPILPCVLDEPWKNVRETSQRNIECMIGKPEEIIYDCEDKNFNFVKPADLLMLTHFL